VSRIRLIATARSIAVIGLRRRSVAGDDRRPDTRNVSSTKRPNAWPPDTSSQRGIFISKPFHEYTVEDFNAVIAGNLAGFFSHHHTAIEQHAERRGHIITSPTTLVEHPTRRRLPHWRR